MYPSDSGINVRQKTQTNTQERKKIVGKSRQPHVGPPDALRIGACPAHCSSIDSRSLARARVRNNVGERYHRAHNAT